MGAVIAVAALIVAAAVGLGLRKVNGRFTPVAEAVAGIPTAGKPATDFSATDLPVTHPPDPVLARLGVTPGTPVTLLQFSSAFCAPCRTTRVLCADLASRMPGVRHIDVDAESQLDAVRALEIWRTPTVLLIDSDGRIQRRASGAPNREQLRSAVETVLGIRSPAA